MRNNQVNFGDILPETSKSSAFWDMGVNSHLKWLLLFSPYEVGEWGRPQSSCFCDFCGMSKKNITTIFEGCRITI